MEKEVAITTLSLSLAHNKACNVPGYDSLVALAASCCENSIVEEGRFVPGKIKKTLSLPHLNLDSFRLILPVLLMRNQRVVFSGGDVTFFKYCIAPLLAPYVQIVFEIGEGIVVKSKPLVSIAPYVALDSGVSMCIRGVSSGENMDIARRQASAAQLKLGGLGVSVTIDQQEGTSAMSLWSQQSVSGGQFPLSVYVPSVGSAEETGFAAADRLVALLRAKASLSHYQALCMLIVCAQQGGRIRAELAEHARAIDTFLGKQHRFENGIITWQV